MRSKFKDEHPFEKRKAEAERIRQKYNDRIPVSFSPSPPLSPPIHHFRHRARFVFWMIYLRYVRSGHM